MEFRIDSFSIISNTLSINQKVDNKIKNIDSVILNYENLNQKLNNLAAKIKSF